MESTTSKIKDIRERDFLAGMEENIRVYYLEKRPFLRRAVLETVPEKVTEEWWEKALGRPWFERNMEHIQKGIYEPMRIYLKVSGKLLRPLLVTLCIEGYGKDPKLHMPAIAMSEIIHSTSLMGDDIIDHSELRRGSPCAHRLYGAARTNVAMMSLDSYVYVLLMNNVMNLDPIINLRLFEAILWEHYTTGFGVAMDLQWSREKRTTIPKDYFLQHVANRSCSYTYRIPIRIGSIVGEAPEEDLRALFYYGQWVGLAFQMKDDLLNLRPQCNSWGKVVGEDITEGKRSLAVLYTLEEADQEDHDRLLEILDSGTRDPREIQEAIGLIDKYGMFERVQGETQRWVDKACEELEGTSILPDHKELLFSFARYCVQRRL